VTDRIVEGPRVTGIQLEISKERRRRIAALLITNRPHVPDSWWSRWLTRAELTKKAANKFLLAAANDYQRRDDPEDRVAEYVESYLGDPEDLWGYIARKWRSNPAEWMEEARRFHLHWQTSHLPTLVTIAERLTRLYDGDSRRLWEGNPTPASLIDLLETRLELSEQLSHMVAGALADFGIIEGRGPVKADTHVRRVLGRVVTGQKISAPDAEAVASCLYSENPWLLDRSLYTLGTEVCHATAPDCAACYLKDECEFAMSRQ
jgi:hypothetical protein